jgi:hypothetical protein
MLKDCLEGWLLKEDQIPFYTSGINTSAFPF